MVNGGYICGFVPDPSDQYVTAEVLAATQGSQTKKWYEDAVVHAAKPHLAQLLYTTRGDDYRLFSPGAFWIVTDGSPSASLNVIITMTWSVTLSTPSYNDASDDSFNFKGEVRPNPGNWNLKYFSSATDTKGTTDFSRAVPFAVRDRIARTTFRVPTFNIEYSEGQGDTGTIQCHFVIYKPSSKELLYSSNGREEITVPWQNNVAPDQVLIPCGTLMKHVQQGNLCSTVTRLRSLSPISEPNLTPSIPLLQQAIKSLKTSSDYSQKDLTLLRKELMDALLEVE